MSGQPLQHWKMVGVIAIGILSAAFVLTKPSDTANAASIALAASAADTATSAAPAAVVTPSPAPADMEDVGDEGTESLDLPIAGSPGNETNPNPPADIPNNVNVDANGNFAPPPPPAPNEDTAGVGDESSDGN